MSAGIGKSLCVSQISKIFFGINTKRKQARYKQVKMTCGVPSVQWRNFTKRLAKIRWYLKEINLNFWRENREGNLPDETGKNKNEDV